jgi:hypothetical protein
LCEPPNLFVHRFRDTGDELRLPGSESILEIAHEALCDGAGGSPEYKLIGRDRDEDRVIG